MIITIATPLWPPELGGPANYAKNLAREFQAAGHKVRVVSFFQGGKAPDADDVKNISFVSLKFPTGLRHFLFFCKLLPKVAGADILFALDQFSVGWPAAAACLILKKPLVLRVEGDFLWESFVERARKDITLQDFYKNTPPLILKERFIKKITGWVLRRANRLVFSSEWRRSMIVKDLRIPIGKTIIIRNACPSVNLQPPVVKRQKIVLWAGRMLYLKNLGRLIRAFARINNGDYELHLVGFGPEQKKMEELVEKEHIIGVKFLSAVSRDKLGEKYKEALFFVLPSLSEVGPNVIVEAIAARTPFIMTKESGYAEYMHNWGLLANPLDEDDLAVKIKIMMSDREREEYIKRSEAFNLYRSWKEAAQDWLGLFYKTIKK